MRSISTYMMRVPNVGRLFSITDFGVLPAVAAQDWFRAAALGALFGYLAYVTYELTNLATLKGWSAQIAVMDIAWGAALSGVAGAVGYWAVRAWADD